MSTKYLCCVLSAVLLITAPAYSILYVDGFEYPKPATTSFIGEGVFQHNIVPIPPATYVGWDIDPWPSTPNGNSLNLYPGIDEVTFLLGPGEYVDFASVDLVNGGGSNSFEAIGTHGSYMVQDTPFLQWQTAETTGEDLGHITMVRLLAYEGAFDNLYINVVSDPGVSGDFNGDGAWDCIDINALTGAIAAGSTDLSFDMNGDGAITLADITDAGTGWLAVGGANNAAVTGGNAFLEGDANLSGSVDVLDFNVWNGSKFTSVAEWCGGDFNASGSVDVSDLNIWNGNKFTSSTGVTAVPEPTTTLWAVLGVGWLLGLARWNRKFVIGARLQRIAQDAL